MPRIFVVDQREFPDPDPALSVEDVRQAFQVYFPELATAEVRTTQRGEDMVHEFVRRTGTKGGRGEMGIRFASNDIEPHSCEKPDLSQGR